MFTSHVESAACLRAIFHLHCNANKVKELPSAERLKGYILSERFARVFKAYVRTHRTTPRCKETRACTSVCTCSFTDSSAIKLARAHTHTHTTCALQSKDASDCVKQDLKSSLPNGGIREERARGGSDFSRRQNAIISVLFFKLKTLNPSLISLEMQEAYSS